MPLCSLLQDLQQPNLGEWEQYHFCVTGSQLKCYFLGHFLVSGVFIFVEKYSLNLFFFFFKIFANNICSLGEWIEVSSMVAAVIKSYVMISNTY